MDSSTDSQGALHNRLSEDICSSYNQLQSQYSTDSEKDPEYLAMVAMLQQTRVPLENKPKAVSSTPSLRSGGSNSISAWFSKHNLRSGLSRQSLKSTTDTIIASAPTTITHTKDDYARPPSSHAAYSITSSIATKVGPNFNTNTNTRDIAYAAYITSVETRELPSGGGLRMGRKKHVVYRIMVSGRNGQWWVARRYSEFYNLYQGLKRSFPKKAATWEEIPSKRIIPSLSLSGDTAAQRKEKLNAFLRSIVEDSSVYQCIEVQRFLRDTPIDTDSIPLSERLEVTHAPASLGLDGWQIVNNPRAVSTGCGLGLGGQRPPLPNEWSRSISGTHNTQTSREGNERMISMPALKGSTAAAIAAAIKNYPPPDNLPPPRPAFLEDIHQNHSTTDGPVYSSVGPALGSDAQRMVAEYEASERNESLSARKDSDPLEYGSVSKRPFNTTPHSMRKKYGLRRNVQYRNQPMPDFSSTQTMPNPHNTGNHDSASNYDELVRASIASNDAAGMTGWAVGDQGNESISKIRRRESDLTGRPHSSRSYASSGTDANTIAKHDRQIASVRSMRFGHSNTVGDPRKPSRSSLSTQRSRDHFFQNPRQGATLDSPGPEPESPEVDVDGKRRPSNMSSHPKIGLDDFNLLSVIGKGSYGKVMLARYKDTGKVLAIKVISKSKLHGRPNEIRRVMAERRVLERTIKHPFLVGLQCAFQTKEKLYFCIDYVNGGELFFHLQKEHRFAENRARFYTAEIASALAYLHGLDIVYRDLKPENCLLDARGHVRIVDFGLAKEVGPVVWRSEGSTLYSVEEGGKTATFCGTPEYLAPEVLLRKSYGKEVDWYCLGAVLYEMLTGLPPFYDQDNNKMYRRILQESLAFPSSLPPVAPPSGTICAGNGNAASNVISPFAQDFVFKTLDRDPERRLGSGVFGSENVKRHMFFYGIDWGKIYRQEYAPPFVPKVSSIFDLSNIDPEFRNEPIPPSVIDEGRVDLLAEAAEAERKLELEMQAQLAAFPSPVNSSTGTFGRGRENDNTRREFTASTSSGMHDDSGTIRDEDLDATIDAFRGFSFVSSWVNDAADS